MVNFDYLYNPEVAKPKFDKNYFVDKKLGFQVIEKGMILPNRPITEELPPQLSGHSWMGLGGIVDNNDEFIMNSHLRYGINGKYTPPHESIQHSTETVIYLGLFHPTWGHAITDNSNRLWFLKSEYFKNEFKNCPLVYTPHGGFLKSKMKTKNFMRLLEIFGVDLDRLKQITEPTRFDKIILPDESYRYSCLDDYPSFFTDDHRETFNHIKEFAMKNRTPTSSKKIYYYHGRYNQIGEERLAEYFRSKGYEVVRPELLTVDEQLNLLINCESFASTHGSISHNVLFLREGKQTIYTTRAPNHFGVVQLVCDQVSRVEANYVDSNLSIFVKGTPLDNCFIISEQLKRLFGDRWEGYAEEDFKIFLQYIKNCLSKNLIVNSKIKELYGKVFEDFMAQLKQREDLITAYNMPPNWETFQPTFTYQTHVHNKGWGDKGAFENQPSNPLDQQLCIEAIKINFPNHKINYSVYFNEEEGWSEEVTNGEQAGTTGKSKPIYGMKVRLDEAGAKELDILYRMHKFDGEWTPWAKNGEELLSQGIKVNAIQIKLQPKKIQADKTDTKKVDCIKLDKDEFDYAQIFFVGNDETIYLHGQRQNMTQRKKDVI